MKKILLIVLSVFSIASYAQDENIDELIRKMFKLQGVEKSWETVIVQIIDLQKESFPNIDTSYWNEFEIQLLDNAYNKILNLLIPVYKKYLTVEELKASIAFYESEEGKSIIEKTPMILQESMEIGANYGKELSTYIVNELQIKSNNKMLGNFDGCDIMKTGKFKSTLPDNTEMTFQRDEKYQYEYYQNTTTKYKIEWLDDCKYTLEILKTDNESMKSMKGHILTVNIFEVSSNYYKYVSSIDNGIDNVFEGKVYKIQ